jgi:hypothetical protein
MRCDEKTTAGHSPADLVLVRSPGLGKSCEQLPVLLARVRPSGYFELLTTGAWARALGYRPEELFAMSLRELMQVDIAAAHRVVAALLDESDDQPLEVTLRCKDRQAKSFRLHRRYDPYEQAMFILADELECAAEQTARASATYDVADEHGRRLPGQPEARPA